MDGVGARADGWMGWVRQVGGQTYPLYIIICIVIHIMFLTERAPEGYQNHPKISSSSLLTLMSHI